MAKAKECVVVCNTKWGYIMQPQRFNSITKGMLFAKKCNMAYRIFVDGELIKSGWNIE